MNNPKCPVCGAEITGAGVKAKADGKEVTVCCNQCANAVKERPADYAGTSR